MSLYDVSDEQDRKNFQKWIRGLLKSNVVTIRFTKKDGTERVMNATLDENKIAKTKNPANDELSDSVIRVTDVDIGEWRSIRYDSIKEINFSL
ncbi:MAG: DUF2693 domain-containing protein [Proteobacteria bacterium]|nr:DUF2693 domain-containing protein [Pseudomonadota bacterium]NBP13481.1 DUF2693 domain-containing protein [bacterium]